MIVFILSFRSEFYKTRKTMGFWSAVLLPFLLCLFVFIGFFVKSDGLTTNSGMELWLKFSAPLLGVMGVLQKPMFIIFIAYSVNSLEQGAGAGGAGGGRPGAGGAGGAAGGGGARF